MSRPWPFDPSDGEPPPGYEEHREDSPPDSYYDPPSDACRVCGCSDEQACQEGCVWAEADLCSRCAREVQP